MEVLLDVRARSGGKVPPNGASEHGADHKVLSECKSTLILRVRCEFMNSSDSGPLGVESGCNLEETKSLTGVPGIL